ncbi:MAG: hypothetical protein Q8T08_00030 [Ignavibacteria bacterium]|nr:hypothetical protein [Ignavibacteria bacterium]
MKKLTEVKKRKLVRDRWFNRLFIVGMILFFAVTSWFAFNSYFRYDIYQERMLAKFENKAIAAQQICMFGDELKTRPTETVVIEGETYYVCCQICADKLKINFHDSQFAVDEYSHHRIKKSKAFIVLTKKSNGKVSYFESEENYNHIK